MRLLPGLAATLWLVTASEHEPSTAHSTPAPSVQDLATIRDLDGLSVSPDGAWAVFQVRRADPNANRYDMAWYLVPTNGGPVRRLADAGEPILLAKQGLIGGFMLSPPPVWSPDSAWIAWLHRQGGKMQIWRSRADGEHTEQLTHNDADVRALVFARDSSHILFETEPGRAQVDTIHSREARAGFLYDRRFFPAYSTAPVMPVDTSFEFGSSSQQLAGARRIWLYDFASRSERPATSSQRAEFIALTAPSTPHGRSAFRGNAASSPAGALVWTEALDQQRRGGEAPLTIVAQPLGFQTPIVCRVTACTAQRIKGMWWRNESEVVFARGEGPLFQDTALYAWRPESNALRRILRTSGKLTSYAHSEWRCSVAQDRLVCFYEESARPRRLVAVDLDSGVIETLYEPNPQFARFDIAPPRRLELRTPSGVTTYGYLVLPPRYRSGARLPLIVVTYRCSGFLRGGTGDEYPIYPFAAEGFAVLCFNAPDTDYDRLATMDWAAYQNWSRGPGDPEKHRVQEALDTAIARLEAMGSIDPGRVGLTGMSFGAETVHYALFNGRRPCAAIASGPGNEPSGTFLYGPAAREIARNWGLGSPVSERWRSLSLSLNAERVSAPFLLNVADREMLGVLESVAALQDAHRAVEMRVYPDEFHAKWQPAHRLAIYNRNIDWMNFWLRGVEDPAPAKAEQYQRWRAMRVKQCELFKGDDAPWYCRQ